jgi:flagellar biosynthesis GTPase FlhF
MVTPPSLRPASIHRVRGRDLREALERARELHGSSALVLAQERAPGGGITVAVADPAARAVARPGRAPCGLDDVERVLRRSGTSAEWIARTLARVERTSARGAFALDAAAEALGRWVPIAPSPKLRRARGPSWPAGRRGGRGCAIALVGPAGAGKTTSVAKLASRLVRGGRRVGLCSTDVERPGALAPLESCAEALQISLDVAGSAAELRAALARSRHRDALLIDTEGHAPAGPGRLQELGQALAGAATEGELHVWLVLPATASRPALERALETWRPASPEAFVVTHLDETRAPAPVLELAAEQALPLAFLGDGCDLARDLHRASAERIADLFLRGRLA